MPAADSRSAPLWTGVSPVVGFIGGLKRFVASAGIFPPRPALLAKGKRFVPPADPPKASDQLHNPRPDWFWQKGPRQTEALHREKTVGRPPGPENKTSPGRERFHLERDQR